MNKVYITVHGVHRVMGGHRANIEVVIPRIDGETRYRTRIQVGNRMEIDLGLSAEDQENETD